MYLRRNRIKTQTQIPAIDEPRSLIRKIKIKNFRNSFEHKNDMAIDNRRLNTHQDTTHKSTLPQLPELTLDKQYEPQFRKVQPPRPKVASAQQKKDKLLNQILHILKPSEEKQASKAQGWRGQNWYMNQFFQEMPHNTTKHYRAPKILQNELMKYTNYSNIVRRKIFSEDKRRRQKTEERGQRQYERNQKQENKSIEKEFRQGDLQKIQIITFSNKFPGLRRE